MAAIDNYETVNDNYLVITPKKEIHASPVDNTASSRDRNIEEFLKCPNEIIDKTTNNEKNISDVNVPPIMLASPKTMNDDNNKKLLNSGRISSIVGSKESEIDKDDNASIDSYHTENGIPDITKDDTHPMVINEFIPPLFIGDNSIRSVEIIKDDHVLTPTIKTIKKNSPKKQKNPSEFPKFADQLKELSATILKKDSEIKRLSEKLLELEIKKSKSTNKHKNESSKTVLSSSSSSSSTKSTISEKEVKIQDNSKDIGKQKPIKAKDEKTKSIGKVKEKKLGKEKSEKDKETKKEKKKDDTPDNEIKKIKKQSFDKECEKTDIRIIQEKMCNLNYDIECIQQANRVAMCTLTKIQNKSGSQDGTTNECLLNKLLVDYKLLKEKLDQLRSEQIKLSQTIPLEDELDRLKSDVNFVRNQNILMQQYVKLPSTRSLNHSSRNDRIRCGFHKSPDSVKSENVGKTFRTRRLSDTSSMLMEDIRPKVWIEPVPYKYNNTSNRVTDKYSSHYVDRGRYKGDNISVESDRTVTTSEMDSEENDWRRYTKSIRNDGRENMDQMSINDYDTFDESTNRDHYQRQVNYGSPFVPKSALELHNDDVVEFIRPGGKICTGRVCFVGYMKGHREMCIGLELDEDCGKHDGTYDGIRYFQCRRNRGVFVSFQKIILAYKFLQININN